MGDTLMGLPVVVTDDAPKLAEGDIVLGPALVCTLVSLPKEVFERMEAEMRAMPVPFTEGQMRELEEWADGLGPDDAGDSPEIQTWPR